MFLSFFDFFHNLLVHPPLALTTVLLLSVLLVNGWTDAPNAIAGAVVTEALSFRTAVALSAICNLLGVLCITSVNASVTETVYTIARFNGDAKTALTALCAGMTAVVCWAVVAWGAGIPTSESHALVAGISGAAVALGGLNCLRLDCWYKVFLGLALSSLVGLFGGIYAQKLLNHIKLSNCTLIMTQILGAAGSSFFHGAQDGQKFLGIFLLGIALAQNKSTQQIVSPPLWLMAVCAVFISLGTLLGGRRIIDTVAREMVQLGPREGAAADLVTVGILASSTFFGVPVSTTHTRTATLLGVTFAGRKRVNWAVAGKITLAWLLTFPGCMIIGYCMAKVFLAVIL